VVISLKKILLFGLIFLCLLLTGCLPKKGGTGGGGVSTQKEEEESYSGNLEKIMALGIPVKCSWKRDENYYGESWVKGKQSYGEVAQEGRKTKVIWKDDCLWAWEEGNPQGTKICMQPSSETPELPQEGQEPIQPQPQQYQPADMEYSCRPAVFGDDKFNPPAEINFLDVDELMNAGNSETGD